MGGKKEQIEGIILGDLTGFQTHRMVITACSTFYQERKWIRDSRRKLKRVCSVRIIWRFLWRLQRQTAWNLVNNENETFSRKKGNVPDYIIGWQWKKHMCKHACTRVGVCARVCACMCLLGSRLKLLVAHINQRALPLHPLFYYLSYFVSISFLLPHTHCFTVLL